MSGFVKLYGSILTSSVWVESHGTRLVWITMLALADKNGEVSAAVPGLANIAHVSIDEAREAIRVLSSPDEDSRTEAHDGRRIEKIEGGWRILNHKKYRDLRTEEAERKAAYRASQQRDIVPDSPGTRGDCPIEAEAEAEADAEAKAVTTASTSAREESKDEEPLTTILRVLKIAPEKHASWTSIAKGMAEGLGAPGMKPVPWDVLREAAVELSGVDGIYSPHRYKVFVAKVIERRQREAEPKVRKFGPQEPPPRKREPYRAEEGTPVRDPVKLGAAIEQFKNLALSPEKPKRGVA